MRAAGIVQEGDPVLLGVARAFDLPAEAEEAARVVEELNAAADRVAALHDFAKGMGLAAPQIGIGRAAAIVRPPGGESLTLLNPVVMEESAQTDEQFEGCLSFFDVRGLVPRPLSMRVAYETVDGTRRVSVFDRGLARLVAHEVDHLTGTLYRTRMRPGVETIPVAEYRGSGSAWRYGR
jgi:peptide deformylase